MPASFGLSLRGRRTASETDIVLTTSHARVEGETGREMGAADVTRVSEAILSHDTRFQSMIQGAQERQVVHAGRRIVRKRHVMAAEMLPRSRKFHAAEVDGDPSLAIAARGTIRKSTHACTQVDLVVHANRPHAGTSVTAVQPAIAVQKPRTEQTSQLPRDRVEARV